MRRNVTLFDRSAAIRSVDDLDNLKNDEYWKITVIVQPVIQPAKRVNSLLVLKRIL